jgi:1,4-alpha-glucan branching enzyme
VTAAMGIQSASSYKAFGNKQTLFEQALARYLVGPVAFIQGQRPSRSAIVCKEVTHNWSSGTPRRKRLSRRSHFIRLYSPHAGNAKSTGTVTM